MFAEGKETRHIEVKIVLTDAEAQTLYGILNKFSMSDAAVTMLEKNFVHALVTTISSVIHKRENRV